MDEWLDRQGLYRKNTALDGTCLFRAVSEQLFPHHNPNGHVILREQCVEFMKKNRQYFESKVTGSFDEYLENLTDSKQWAGQLELEALSLIHEVDFLVFKSVDLAPVPATQNGFQKKLMLCFTPDNFYDAVYPKSYIEDAGFCQSIVYGVLYRGVFKLDDLEYAVEKMLHDKSARAQREKYLNSQSQMKDQDAMYDFYLEDSDGPINMKELLDMGAILFPYKVAKALDPDIYRNIDFDNWVDTLRVPKKNSFWFGNGGPLRVGVKCMLKFDDKCYNAHVQEMSPDCGPVLVFVEELGEKMTVPFENLEPLPRTSLKPEWTFSHKHQIINKLNANKSLGSNEEASKNKNRNKNRRFKDQSKYQPALNDRKKENAGENKILIADHEKSQFSKFGDSQNNDSRNCSSVNSVSLNNGTSSETASVITTTSSTPNGNVVVVAEPDSTTPNYSLSPTVQYPPPHYGNGMIMASCGWTPNPYGPAPVQPQYLDAINCAATRSVKTDFSDLPLSDLKTLRFFYNLGIEYFKKGRIVYTVPTPPIEELSPVKSPDSYRAAPKTPEDSGAKQKIFKNQQKPPRFLKMESQDPKTGFPDKVQRCASVEDSYQNEAAAAAVPDAIQVAVPYAPYAVQYPMQYHVPSYPVQHIQEPMPMESAPMTPITTYPEHTTHYIEPQPYTIPYTVYSHPQYYYQN